LTRRRPTAAVRLSILTATIALLLAGSAQAVPPTFFGVVSQTALGADDYARMGAADVGLLRAALPWSASDPGPAAGDENWADFDGVVGGAAREGIRVLPFVFSAPEWVLALDGHECRPQRCLPYPPRGDPALAAWSGFLRSAVERYGPAGTFWSEHPELPALPIRAWQIWNEQNSPTFFAPKPSVRVYARMLKAAHEAISTVDPDAKVILGGMFGKPLGGLKPVIPAADFLAQLYQRPHLDRAFDGVAAHPYGPRMKAVRFQVELMRRRIRRAGDDAKLWITEIGWASGGPAHPLNRGPEGQARRLRKAFAYLLAQRKRLRIATVDWYAWRDTPDSVPNLCVWCTHSGLLSADGVPKPAFAAFAQMAGGDGLGAR